MEIEVLTESISDWLGQGFSGSTRRLYRLGLLVFLEYLDETEGGTWTTEKILEARLKDVQDRKFWFETKLVDFYEWLKTYKSKGRDVPYERRNGKTGRIFRAKYHIPEGRTPSDSERKGFLNAVRSFFAFHRLDFKLIRQQKRILGKRAHEVFQDYLFDLDQIAKMADVGSPQEKYILLVGKDLGLRAIDFIGLKQGLFANGLDKEPPVFLGKIYTEKQGVYAFPFLSEDGLTAARLWLRVLESKGLHDDNKPMLAIKSKELSENLKRTAQKAGINTHGQRIRFHCLRKFLIDRISLQMSESKWKQIVGKEIDEGAYVSPLQLREAFKAVMKHIQIAAVKKGVQLSDEETKDLLKIAQLFREGKLIAVSS